MSTSSTVSVPQTGLPNRESCQRTVILTIELTRGQALSLPFTNAYIIMGLVYEHMNMESMVVQTLEAKATLLVLPESEQICSTLISLEIIV